MTKSKYLRKCNKLFRKAKRNGVTLDFNPYSFNPNRLNCLWHGGHIATVKVSKGLEIDIAAIGDVIARLYDENGVMIASSKDKSNQGAFESNMIQYIKDDNALVLAEGKGLLELLNNNWIEYDGILEHSKTGKRYFVDLGMIVDNILDNNILEAIDQVLDSLDSIKKEILDTAKL